MTYHVESVRSKGRLQKLEKDAKMIQLVCISVF